MRERSDALEATTLALATLRLTRLATRDTLPAMKAARDSIIRRYGKESSVAELVSCPFCASVWSAGIILGLRKAGPVGKTLVDILALSGAVSAIWKNLEWDEE